MSERTVLQAAEDLAAVSAGFLALEFVCLPETWPVFVAWTKNHGALYPDANPETMAPLVANLRARMYQEMRHGI